MSRNIINITKLKSGRFGHNYMFSREEARESKLKSGPKRLISWRNMEKRIKVSVGLRRGI